MGQQPLIQLRDTELKKKLGDFCGQTKRGVPQTLRGIIELFFAEGFDVASDRLNQGLWEPAKRRRPKGSDG